MGFIKDLAVFRTLSVYKEVHTITFQQIDHSRVSGHAQSIASILCNVGGVNYFTYDGGLQDLIDEAERQNQLRMNRQIRQTSIPSLLRVDLLTRMYTTLTTSHPMIAELQSIATADANHDVDAIIRISEQNKFIGVASFVNNNIAAPYACRIKVKENGAYRYNSIENTDPKIEPLCYPLLFPCGECGFNPFDKRIRLTQYITSRLLMPEPQFGIFHTDRIQIPLNRFILMGRLMQYWLCETLSRAINYRIEFHRRNQQTLFGINFSEDDNEDDLDNDSDDDEGDNERQHFSSKNKTFLADSFTGSPRHLKKLSMNALTIVSELGPPDAFITITFNPLWPEVTQALLSGQSVFDRPDLQARIFHARLEAFLSNLRSGKYYKREDGSPIGLAYLLRVIEYQNRGLPHCHVVHKLDHEHNPIKFMDSFCRSTISNLSDSNENQRNLKSLIQQHMLHRCSAYCCSKGSCEKGFGNKQINLQNRIDSKGFPVHKRLAAIDFNIVPTHDLMIQDWDGHINHEPAAQAFTVLYLFKYLFKGNKKLNLEISEEDNGDEIKQFAYGKMLCASDAAWRMFGFQNYPKSDPTTVLIKIKTTQQIEDIMSKNQLCDLIVYFNRLNSVLPLTSDIQHELTLSTYTQFFQKWIYKRTRPNIAIEFYEIRIPFRRSTTHLFIVRRRNNGKRVVVRMGTVYITTGEPWFLRLLLLRKPATSMDELRTVDGIRFSTFQDAAVKCGYVTNHTAAKICFDEMKNLKTPNELRIQFVTMTLAGYPTLLIINDRECVQSMMLDYLDANDGNWEISKRSLMLELSRRFRLSNACMADYGMQEPPSRLSEYDFAKLRYNVQTQRELYNDCLEKCPFTPEMKVGTL